MTRITVGRVGATLGLALVLGTSVAMPASAGQDLGSTPSVTLPYPQGTYQCHYLNQCAGTDGPGITGITDTDVEYLQIGGGVLAGLALAGAGMTVASRRNHAQVPHPA
jgi:hypothetical protein